MLLFLHPLCLLSAWDPLPEHSNLDFYQSAGGNILGSPQMDWEALVKCSCHQRQQEAGRGRKVFKQPSVVWELMSAVCSVS